MKLLFAALILAISAGAQTSHPSFWNFAPGDATSLVGIRWQAAKASLFGEALKSQLGSQEGLGLPELGVLDTTQQIFLAGPHTLGVLTGKYQWTKLRAEGNRKGFTDDHYRGVPILRASRRGVWSIAFLSDQVLLAGDRRAIQSALDRADYESGSAAPPKGEHPSFARASVLHQKYDFWILAKEYPDELAGEFVALEDIGGITSIDGGVSFRKGLDLDAVLTTGSEEESRRVAANLQEVIPEMPAIAREMKIAAAGQAVKVQMRLSETRLAELTQPPGAAAETSVAAEARDRAPAASPVPNAAASSTPEAGGDKAEEKTPAERASERAAAERASEEVAKPKVIRIFGLDEGVREIPLKKPGAGQ